MNKVFLFVFAVCFAVQGFSQTQDSCKLIFGTNIGGISDYGSEMPFKDRMRYSRQWYSKDDNPEGSPWDTEAADSLDYRPDGYPTHIPQIIPGRTYPQKIATVWAGLSGWEEGTYVVIYEGSGGLSFWGDFTNLNHPATNRYTIHVTPLSGGIIQMTIDSSALSDPVHNIRVFKASEENSYVNEPFEPKWIEYISKFKSVRFMDWGRTNNWGRNESWDWDDSTKYDWSDRARYDYYTWTTPKGVPYEMMVKLMNDHNIDGWVCVPHSASDNYITEMATFFRDSLDANRTLTVEYSNEIWNWSFGQANWLYKYGCVNNNIPWPEGIVPYIENCMRIWTNVFESGSHRIRRVVGVQTGWLDVAKRTALNVPVDLIDAIAPTYYFGLTDEADLALDALGVSATTRDVASWVRQNMPASFDYIRMIKDSLADYLGKPIVFYEGGQHITPIPFGEEPAYAGALIDIQRDTIMYNLYNEWFGLLKTLENGKQPLECMNFALIAERSARYGSWGILETMNQDTTAIPAPKFKAIMEHQHLGCIGANPIAVGPQEQESGLKIYPNPGCAQVTVSIPAPNSLESVKIFDMTGKAVYFEKAKGEDHTFNVSNLASGIYLVQIKLKGKASGMKLSFVKY